MGRGSTCWPAWIRACIDWVSTTSTSSTTTASTRTRRLRRPSARSIAAVRQGKALYVGVSSYSDQRTSEAIEILRGLGTPLLIHQPSYSMFNRWIEDRLLDVLEEEGVGCIGFSPLAQGLLTDRYLNGIPEGSRAHARHVHVARHAEQREPRSCACPAHDRRSSGASRSPSWRWHGRCVTLASPRS